MKSICKALAKRVSALALTAVLMAQTALVVLPPQTAYATDNNELPTVTVTADSNAQINNVLTSYLPQVIPYTDPISGFTHPGVGVTKEILENVQTQVRNGIEPWKSYFETMLLNDTNLSGKNVGPKRNGGNFNNNTFNNDGDGARAYAQAVMYFVTGDNAYRRNALRIIRAYEDINPEDLAYFNDACIHMGIPTNRICIAAEILRYSTYEVTDGYTDAELAWTDEDTEKFISNFLAPEVEVFQFSPDRFMNQHLYTTIGAMSAALFMDDAENYAKTVEWFTVNRNARDQGQNGSIERLFREITTVDEVGQKEGSGTKLAVPVIQHVEMGRDQAHGCGDLTNSAILSRLMQSQGTKVDPEYGTVSTAADAVDCYTFLDDRLVKAADFFFEYMLGYDTDWVSVPFAIDYDGTIKDSYAAFASSYRGRYSTINFWDFYTYYRYNRNMSPEQIKATYPFFYDGYTQKIYSSWGNNDGGGDFWLFLPAGAAGDTSFIPAASEVNVIEVENRGNVVSGNGTVQSNDSKTYIHVTSTNGARIAMNSAGIGSDAFLFRVRTDGVAKLTMSGGPNGTIYLPDTQGEWVYVTYNKNTDEGLGDMYFFTISDLGGTYVDVDAIYTAPKSSKIAAVAFESGREEYKLDTYVGAPFQMVFVASDTATDAAVSYSLINAPSGVTVDADGTVKWSPAAAGSYTFYIQAKAGDSVALKKIDATVSGSRMDAVNNAASAYDENAVYTTVSDKKFKRVLEEAKSAAADNAVTDEAFAAKLNELSAAVAELELVSPLLTNDPLTDGTSLDFSKMNVGDRSTFGYGDTPVWLDGEPGSFVGYWLVENKGCIMDFGVDYKISVNKFGFQARAGFSDRLAGVQVFGSNDRENWTKLTVAEAAYQQAYQTVDVAQQYHNEQYRYLMFKKTTEYPDVLSGSVQNLLEIAEVRMWGIRYETGNLIASISMSSDAVKDGRIKMGDTVKVKVQGRDTLSELKVKINGIDAAVTEGQDNLYTATAVMNSTDCKTGYVSVQVDYKKLDGTDGNTFYGTTDGSSLFLINSDAFIDVGMLARELKATSGSWDNRLDEEAVARLLFDGDPSTFGDLKTQWDDYYMVDFGEGVTVSLMEVMIMPRSDKNFARTNGTIIYGSNDTTSDYDSKAWTQITPPVEGVALNTWSHIPSSKLLDNGSYRFFKIAGAEQGDIGEVEFYGTYGADVGMVAGQLKSLPVQEATQTTLVYPSIPAGFTVTVKSSSNENVIGTDGTVCAVASETTVNLVLVVKGPDGTAVDTASIPVTVKGLDSIITGLQSPAKGASALTLPDVPAGFTVAVESSSNTSVVSAGNGTITQPEQDTLVTVTLKLTRTSDQVSVISKEYTILIYGTTEAGKIDVMHEAADVVASSTQWGGTPDAKGAAALIFDGDLATCGDLQARNNPYHYAIDFGNGVTVLPSKFRLYPRSDGTNNTQYIPRMNGVVIKGSNDNQNWVDITAPIANAQPGWNEISAEQFVNCGSFRYFRIAGGDGGNFAELEIYGTVSRIEVPPVPDAPEIDVKALAEAQSATWTDATESLFDNNTNTFGEPSSATYTIDFGAGNTVTPVKFEVYPRLGSDSKPAEEFVDRLNNLKFQGSNDGTNWVDLTAALTGIGKKDSTAIKWHELPVNQNVGSYRYILITGASYGNMSEVKIYGNYVEGEKPPVEEVPEINIRALVEEAQSATWTEQTNALFDGDTGTSGEPSSATYTIDFGVSNTVTPVKFEVYPRLGSGQKPAEEFVARLNGLKFQGSNDGTNWVDLTDALAGIGSRDTAAVKWHELTVNKNAGSYRYICITGAQFGNMSEVKIYGTVTSTPETIAEFTFITPAEPAFAEADENIQLDEPVLPEVPDSAETDPAEPEDPPAEPEEPEVPEDPEANDADLPVAD